VAIPLVVSQGTDVFRLPKELLFEAVSAIVFSACLIQTLLCSENRILIRLRGTRPAVAIALAAVVWTLITTATSTQRLLSIQTLIWVACCAMFFLSALALLQRRAIGWLLIPLIPATVNAVIALLQRLQIWNPIVFPAGIPLRLRVTGLVGNPDDVGAFLVLPLIASAMLVIDRRSSRRLLYAVMTVLIAAGLLATETISALLAAALAAAVVLLRLPRRMMLGAALAAALSVGAVFALHLPVATRLSEAVEQLTAGNVHGAMSFRTQPYFAAWGMFLDHPFTGVGPGCYGFWYVPYSIRFFPRHPEFMEIPEHFAEAHNDHMQLLATAGLPAYAIFCAALWCLASARKTTGAGPRAAFARAFAAPATVAIAVVSAGLFPLELAAPTCVILYFAAAANAWGGAEA
jgi:O-antigen ligase